MEKKNVFVKNIEECKSGKKNWAELSPKEIEMLSVKSACMYGGKGGNEPR